MGNTIQFTDPDVDYFRFEWDDDKCAVNIEKHGLDFQDVAKAFIRLEGLITEVDDRFDYGEERFISVARCLDKIIVIAHTENADLIRIISAREAEPHEESTFYKTLNGE